jgi:hypothetical protein
MKLEDLEKYDIHDLVNALCCHPGLLTVLIQTLLLNIDGVESNAAKLIQDLERQAGLKTN